jgi:hypothetical protein
MLDRYPYAYLYGNVGNYTTGSLKGEDTTTVIERPFSFSLCNLLRSPADGSSDTTRKTKEGWLRKR